MAFRGDIFGSVPIDTRKRTNFDLSHQVTGNFKEGICYPIFCEETLPGDSWKIVLYNITKLQTMLAPAMQRTKASMLWFKIPKRLCMRKFKKWYTGGIDGKAIVEKPYFTFESVGNAFAYIRDHVVGFDNNDMLELTELICGPGSLWQCLGLPVFTDENNGVISLVPPYTKDSLSGEWISNWDGDFLDEKIDLIPFIAYAILFDDEFRDQTLSQPIFSDDPGEFPDLNPDWTLTYTFSSGRSWEFTCGGDNVFDGGEFNIDNIWPLFFLFRRAWQKDYFTSALPTPQRGPEVTVNVFGDSQNVPVSIPAGRIDIADPTFDVQEPLIFEEGAANWGSLAEQSGYLMDGDEQTIHNIAGTREAMSGTADISGLSPITIAAFRSLFKLQAFLEKNNVAGGRYIEHILAHWAERVPDFTVQRPVFVRATEIPVIVSEVTATAETQGGLNGLVGDQAGRAKAQGNLGSCRIYTQEPSIIIGIYCVSIPPSYASQGIPKKFQRMTHWDEPDPDFQHIGEQAILNKELYLNFTDSDGDNNREFGYQQRYSEYKYLPDRVIGDFVTSLAYWHQARIFKDTPNLNQTFIEQHPSERIFAVEGQKPVIADFWFDIRCKRKLSKFSTPKLT